MTHDELAAGLLAPLWRGVSADYKAKYSYSIWQQFEDNIRSAAYTARLAEFLSKIVTRLGIDVLEKDVASVRKIIAGGQDKATLKMLRDDTTLLVLIVRADNERRKESFKKRQVLEDYKNANLDL